MFRGLLGMMLGVCLMIAPARADEGEPMPPERSALHDEARPRAEAFGKEKEEEEAAMSEAEKEAAQRRRDRAARVVVLKWPGTEADYKDDTIRRNVRSRIDRADALFFPSVDLYQNGRKFPDRTIRPADQPAMVPDENLDVLLAAAREVSQIPYDAMSPTEWGLKAQELLRLVDKVWFVGKVEQREPLFILYSQIGIAGENSNNPAPPFFEAIGGQFVNYYYYLCAALAWQDPSLMSKLTNQDINASVNYYLQMLDQGSFPMLTLDFELENEFDLEAFSKEYTVMLNGLEVELNFEARYQVPLGRHDIYLQRKDTGHGLSEKLIVDKLEEKAYFVRDVARKKMGIEFIDQLFKHPNECTPELDGDILNYLAIYAKLHPEAEIYISVPRYGNPNKLWIWRYDRSSATLQLVGGGNDGFPVRFAVLADVGILYNGVSFTTDKDVDQADISSALNTTARDEFESRFDATPEAGTLPLTLELRGHYNRLMVDFGGEIGWNLAEDGLFIERYYTPSRAGAYDEVRVVADPNSSDVDTGEVDEDGNPILATEYNGREAFHQTPWNRYMYMGAAVVLGRDASLGFGPRLGVKVGWVNNPRAIQTTAHFGWTLEAPIPGIKATNRVRPLIDVDGRAGVGISLPNTINADLAENFDDVYRVGKVFGLSAGIGTTF
ncbi:MAG: hypothetical protein H6741_05585 [Alphaproteobacteria bacterium]|nr:hypothetical protein [Alphaproteobacteria bacterium]